MRLLDVFQAPDYEPLDRGYAFPQYHEDGDKFSPYCPGDWSYAHWKQMQRYARYNSYPSNDEMLMMIGGGEL